MKRIKEGKTILEAVGVMMIVEGASMVSSGQRGVGAGVVFVGLLTMYSYHYLEEGQIESIAQAISDSGIEYLSGDIENDGEES